MCTMIHTALSVCGDAVRLAVLLEAQLQLMQVHWSRVDPGALQVHPDALTPLPPSEDSYFFFFFLRKERKDIEGYIIEHQHLIRLYSWLGWILFVCHALIVRINIFNSLIFNFSGHISFLRRRFSATLKK